MTRSLLALSAAMLAPGLWAQDAQQKATTPPQKTVEELKTQRPPQKTSGHLAVPPEEDKSYLREAHDFNPLQSKKNVETGDFYWHKGKVQAAANRYEEATMFNDGNAEAWLKLGKAEEKLRDAAAAKAAYTKYLAVAPDAKDASDVRKKLAKLK